MSCFSGESKILTREGHIEIKELVERYGINHPVIVWNGTKWIPARFYETNERMRLFYIFFRYYTPWDNKTGIVCTEYTNLKIDNQLFNVLEIEAMLKKGKPLPVLDKYIMPNKDPRGWTELVTIDNATIYEINMTAHYKTYSSDADSLIVDNILVY